MLIGEATYRLVRDAVEVEPVAPLDAEGQGRARPGVPADRGPRGRRRPRAASRLADGRARRRSSRCSSGRSSAR